jgi:hypothetical protein
VPDALARMLVSQLHYANRRLLALAEQHARAMPKPLPRLACAAPATTRFESGAIENAAEAPRREPKLRCSP